MHNVTSNLRQISSKSHMDGFRYLVKSSDAWLVHPASHFNSIDEELAFCQDSLIPRRHSFRSTRGKV